MEAPPAGRSTSPASGRSVSERITQQHACVKCPMDLCAHVPAKPMADARVPEHTLGPMNLCAHVPAKPTAGAWVPEHALAPTDLWAQGSARHLVAKGLQFY